MSRKRTFRLALVLAALLALPASPAGAAARSGPASQTAPVQPHSPSPKADLLAVVNAPRGTFARGTLALEHVRPAVTWFTDRPYRDAGFFGVGEMVRLFFARQSPPNVALEFRAPDGSHHVAIVEVSAPRYDRKAGRLKLHAKLISKSDTVSLAEHPWLSKFGTRNEARIPRRLGAVVAFFDSAPAPGQSQDEALVQKLADEYQPLEESWARVIGAVKACLDNTRQTLYQNLLEATVGDYKKWLALWRDVEALQRAVAGGGTLSTAQHKLAGELEAEFAEQQQTVAGFAFVERATCARAE
jgi:hypothetical protein